MMMRARTIWSAVTLVTALSAAAPTAATGVTAFQTAKLVIESDTAKASASLHAAFQSDKPLVRATAARVIAIRGFADFLPLLRERVTTESDATAAREQLRALAMLGTEDDVKLAVNASSRWPAAMDNALAVAVARRGGAKAIDAYTSLLRKTRMDNVTEFFRVALWGNTDVIPFAGSRILAARDERAWRGVLGALEESQAAMNPGVLAASLGSPSEDIQATSVWFLVRSYDIDPKQIPDVVQGKINEERGELSSDRVDFGIELLRRMLGAEKKGSERWLKFLDTDEADRLLRGETVALQYLTDEEYRVRFNRCEIQLPECYLPSEKKGLTIRSTPVTPPAFNLPEVLPDGLGEAILTGTKCSDWWMGVANTTVDGFGRVKTLDLENVQTGNGRPCKEAIELLLRLSMATNTSLRSGFDGVVLLVRHPRAPLCLDEAPPVEGVMPTLVRAGGGVETPKITRRVEPDFPEKVRREMSPYGKQVVVIMESIISTEGCVRSVRLLSQSPYPELNAAALMGLAQWKFKPGHIDGKPVDVIFNLVVNFKLQ
jgi:TonB family protein